MFQTKGSVSADNNIARIHIYMCVCVIMCVYTYTYVCVCIQDLNWIPPGYHLSRRISMFQTKGSVSADNSFANRAELMSTTHIHYAFAVEGIYTYMCVYVCVYTCVYVCVYMCVYAWIYMCMCVYH